MRRRRPAGDTELALLGRAVVTELGRLCEPGPAPWVALFLDGWPRELIDGAYSDLPLEVVIVLAGRDELAERDRARLRPPWWTSPWTPSPNRRPSNCCPDPLDPAVVPKIGNPRPDCDAPPPSCGMTMSKRAGGGPDRTRPIH
ncbi:hypothetical protein [Streptomyces sp. TLI_171]|uniref:hypothetical protein n=1 Tax=Streptomyces sp. TLI_171 TaxID=1938859 RepID=UPI000C18B02B|nr:hypothetical protein [Streptomyces sp. TLI_171]RKE21822.1 hypothetical protein BX266_5223 [Streptomyces sp. TLI_171]